MPDRIGDCFGVCQDLVVPVANDIEAFAFETPIVKAKNAESYWYGLTAMAGPLVSDLAPLSEEQRRAVAVVYSLHSVGTYLLYRDSFGLSSREAGEAAGWAVGLVIDDLERRAQQRKR